MLKVDRLNIAVTFILVDFGATVVSARVALGSAGWYLLDLNFTLSIFYKFKLDIFYNFRGLGFGVWGLGVKVYLASINRIAENTSTEHCRIVV